jgi:thioredoxin reductase
VELAAAAFLARAGLGTPVLDAAEPSPSGGPGGSILRRNAHLENYPGFPAGVDARLLLGLMRDGAERAGCEFRTGTATRVRPTAEGFLVETADGDRSDADYVIAATRGGAECLAAVDGVALVDRGKAFVAVDDRGRTGVPGLYAAGRLAGKPHRAVASAGHGAAVAVTLLEDDDRPFYHDWVAPAGSFTDRGRDVPPGREEVDDAERRRRRAASRATMRE